MVSLFMFGIVFILCGYRITCCPGGLRSELIDDFHDLVLMRRRGFQVAPSFLRLEKAVVCGVVMGSDTVADVPVIQYGGHELCLHRVFKNRDGDKRFVRSGVVNVAGRLMVHGVFVRIGSGGYKKLEYFIIIAIIK